MPAILLIFYRIYQVVIMCPLLIVATILTAVATVIGSALGFGGWWGYYPEILWSRLFCWLAFVRVTVSGRENIDSKVSYMFVANHQGLTTFLLSTAISAIISAG